MNLRPIVKRTVLSVGLVLAGSTAALGKESFSYAEFKPLVDAAMNEISKRDDGYKGRLLGKEIQLRYEEASGLAPQGGWRAVLPAACTLAFTGVSVSNDAGKVMTYQAPVAISNNGTNFVYQFSTQAVSDTFRAEADKEIQRVQKELSKEYDEMQILIELQADKTYLLRALYPYAKGATEGRIRDRLVTLMNKSRFLLCDLTTAVELGQMNAWKRLKGDVQTLTQEEFLVLYPQFREKGYATTNDANPHGQWRAKGEGFGIYVENLHNQMKLWVSVVPRGTMTEEVWNARKAKLMALKPPSGATTEMTTEPGLVWVGYVYPYAGMTGREVMDTVKDFMDKDSDKLASKVNSILN